MDSFEIINKTNFDIEKYKRDFINVFYEIKRILSLKASLELSLVIVNPQMQLKINKKYRKKNYVADVIAFAIEDNNALNIWELTGVRTLGDIFICYEKAFIQAKIYKHSLRRELAFLFTHGMLHVLGYDHIIKNDETIMVGLQKEILNNLQIYKKKW